MAEGEGKGEGEEGGDKSRIKSASSQGWQALKTDHIWKKESKKAGGLYDM